jgi:hypothetical protein
VGHGFLGPGIVAACAEGCARPPGANTLGSSQAVGAQRPPAWPYADSSVAFDSSVESVASVASSAFGAFTFADRLPDRTERNARRTGAPEAAPQVRNIRMNRSGAPLEGASDIAFVGFEDARYEG